MKRSLMLVTVTTAALLVAACDEASAHGWRWGCGRSYGYYGNYGGGYYGSYYPSYSNSCYGGYGSYGSYPSYGQYPGYGVPSFGMPGYGAVGNFGGGLGGVNLLNVVGAGGLGGQASYISVPVSNGFGQPSYIQLPVGNTAGRASYMQVPISSGFGPTTYLQIQLGGTTTGISPASPAPSTVPPFGFLPGTNGNATADRLTLDSCPLIDIDAPPTAIPQFRESRSPASLVSEPNGTINASSASVSDGGRKRTGSDSVFHFAVMRTEREVNVGATGGTAAVRIESTGFSLPQARAEAQSSTGVSLDLGPYLGVPVESTIGHDESIPWTLNSK